MDVNTFSLLLENSCINGKFKAVYERKAVGTFDTNDEAEQEAALQAERLRLQEAEIELSKSLSPIY
jgi:hypothetical protein